MMMMMMMMTMTTTVMIKVFYDEYDVVYDYAEDVDHDDDDGDEDEKNAATSFQKETLNPFLWTESQCRRRFGSTRFKKKIVIKLSFDLI